MNQATVLFLGANWDFRIAEPWAAWLSILIALVATVIVIKIYQREPIQGAAWIKWALASLRIFSIVLVIFMLYQWTWLPLETEPPDLVVLLDNSLSMRNQDVGRSSNQAKLDRFQLAKQLIQQAILNRPLDDQYRLRLVTLDGEISIPGEASRTISMDLQETQANRDASDLGDRLANLVSLQRARSTAAIILLSDGVTTQGQSLDVAAKSALANQIPVYTVGVGDPTPVADASIKQVDFQPIAYLNDVGTFEVQIESQRLDGQEMEVILRRSHDDSIADRQTITLTSKSRQSVTLADRLSRLGRNEFRIQLDAPEQDRQSHNNSQDVVVDVRDATLTVAVIADQPSYEYRYLKHALERTILPDSRAQNPVDLLVALQDADADYVKFDRLARSSLPALDDDFEKIDVFVLIDASPKILGEQTMARIEQAVAVRGRGLVMSASPLHLPMEYVNTPLSNLLPFPATTVHNDSADATSSFRIRLTPTGTNAAHLRFGTDDRVHLSRWNNLPISYWQSPIHGIHPDARILAEAQSEDSSVLPSPLITLHYHGAGKVLYHAFDSTWRWQYPAEWERHSAYWLQSLRFLADASLHKEDDNLLSVERTAFRDIDSVRIKATLRAAALGNSDGSVSVRVRSNKTVRNVALTRQGMTNVFVGSVTSLPPAEYSATLFRPALPGEAPSCVFRVVESNLETEQTVADHASLASVSKLTNGRFATYDEAVSMLEQLPAGKRVLKETRQPKSLWNAWPTVWLFSVAVTLEWILRKRVGVI
ncbi:MAG: VWA domain-containing protein [Pirellulaceae bacterium]